jgi:hypothetical protein
MVPLVIGAVLVVIGLVVGGMTLYRVRENRKTDRAIAREWDGMHGWRSPGPDDGDSD